MGVAVPQDAGIGRAVLVEQCSCPTGYSGTSCEVCAPGFQKNPSTGRCQGCNCNGHSNDCDPLTGRCRVSTTDTESSRFDSSQKKPEQDSDLRQDVL